MKNVLKMIRDLKFQYKYLESEDERKVDRFLMGWVGLELVIFCFMLIECVGCATAPSHIQIADDDKCKTRLTCEEMVGDKCVNLKITLDGNCQMQTDADTVGRGNL